MLPKVCENVSQTVGPLPSSFTAPSYCPKNKKKKDIIHQHYYFHKESNQSKKKKVEKMGSNAIELRFQSFVLDSSKSCCFDGL